MAFLFVANTGVVGVVGLGFLITAPLIIGEVEDGEETCSGDCLTCGMPSFFFSESWCRWDVEEGDFVVIVGLL